MQSNPNEQNPSDTEAGRRLGDALVAAQVKFPGKSLGVILLDVEDALWESRDIASLSNAPDDVLIKAVYEYARG